MLTSCAVENTPACPATPPMRRAVGSSTVPKASNHNRDSCSDRLRFRRHVLLVRCATKDWRSMHLQDKRPARALLAREPMQSPLLSSCVDHRLWPGEDSGFFHAKRRKYVLLNVNVFGLACDFLDQRAKQNEVDVGVAEDLTGTGPTTQLVI